MITEEMQMVQMVAVKVFNSLGVVLPESVDKFIAQTKECKSGRDKTVCNMAASFVLTSTKPDELVFLALVAAEAITRLAEKDFPANSRSE